MKRRPAYLYHPGEYLLHELATRGISVEEFADNLGWPIKQLENILLCKSPIDEKAAHEIGDELGTSAILWARLNDQYYEAELDRRG